MRIKLDVCNKEGVCLMIGFVECVKPVSKYTKDEAGVFCLELSSNTCGDLRLVLPLKYRSTEINVAHSLGQFSFKETVQFLHVILRPKCKGEIVDFCQWYEECCQSNCETVNETIPVKILLVSDNFSLDYVGHVFSLSHGSHFLEFIFSDVVMFIFEFVLSMFAKPKVKYKCRLKVRLSCERAKPKVKFKGISVKIKVRMKCKRVKPNVKIRCIKLVLNASLA